MENTFYHLSANQKSVIIQAMKNVIVKLEDMLRSELEEPVKADAIIELKTAWQILLMLDSMAVPVSIHQEIDWGLEVRPRIL